MLSSMPTPLAVSVDVRPSSRADATTAATTLLESARSVPPPNAPPSIDRSEGVLL
jgi:hypothetical protein